RRCIYFFGTGRLCAAGQNHDDLSTWRYVSVIGGRFRQSSAYQRLVDLRELAGDQHPPPRPAHPLEVVQEPDQSARSLVDHRRVRQRGDLLQPLPPRPARTRQESEEGERLRLEAGND